MASDMSWYVLQTYTGREQKLTEMIHRTVPRDCYGECFVPYYEQLRDRKQENRIHILRLFPGYVLISSEDIGQLFQKLKRVPAMSKIVEADTFTFLPMQQSEAKLLLDVMDADHVVRLTYVETDGKNHVSYLSGPLEKCRDLICAYQFRKRFAQVRLRFAGQEKIVRMGIILNDDVRREMVCGKAKEQARIPELCGYSATEESAACLAPGDRVVITEGPFEGKEAVVSRLKRNMAVVSVEMFGREIILEIPTGSIRKSMQVRGAEKESAKGKNTEEKSAEKMDEEEKSAKGENADDLVQVKDVVRRRGGAGEGNPKDSTAVPV